MTDLSTPRRLIGRTILLAPHNDDEVLWTSHVLFEHRPLVVVCLRSHVQELRGMKVTHETREAETAAALGVFGIQHWHQWDEPDHEPDWDRLRGRLEALRDELALLPRLVYAPAPEPGGHEHHNRIGELAREVFPARFVRHYLTYTEAGKSTWGERVPMRGDTLILKLRALACYETQIMWSGGRPHFLRGLDEYIANGRSPT